MRPVALPGTRSTGAGAAFDGQRTHFAMLPTLHLARYRFVAVFERDLELPEFAGALLRSVFGLALHRGACLTDAPHCEPCPLYRSCAYPSIFGTPPRETQLGQRVSLHPYVLEPPPLGTQRVPAGEPVAWQQVIFGRDALRHIAVITRAWQRSLRLGWGERRVRGQLRSVESLPAGDEQPHVVFDASSGSLKPHSPILKWAAPPLNTHSGVVHLDLETPLRMQQDGRPLRPEELSPRKLVADLLRRCNLMLDLHLGIRPAPFDAGALVAHAQTLRDDRSALRWRDDARYSARQRQEFPLGGVIGRWSLHGDLRPLLPWLWFGQWLHLGKNTTHGLGGYRLILQETPR